MELLPTALMYLQAFSLPWSLLSMCRSAQDSSVNSVTTPCFSYLSLSHTLHPSINHSPINLLSSGFHHLSSEHAFLESPRPLWWLTNWMLWNVQSNPFELQPSLFLAMWSSISYCASNYFSFIYSSLKYIYLPSILILSSSPPSHFYLDTLIHTCFP